MIEERFRNRILRLLATFLVVIAAQAVVFASARPAFAQEPTVTCAAAIVVDAETGAVLYEKNADERRPIASLTKVMTALVAAEQVRDWDMPVVADSQSCAAGESEIYLEPGERILARDLLAATLLKSANDAASLLARAVAGRTDLFVAMMNAKARSLGLTNTSFKNPHGLYQPGHYSSARDCATIARAALSYARLRELFRTRRAVIPWPGHPEGRVLVNHNKLLFRDPNVKGIKTGYVRQSGHCLISYAEYGNRKVIAVVLGAPTSEACYADSVRLLRYGASQFTTVTVARRGEAVGTITQGRIFSRTVPVYAAEGLSVVVPAPLASRITTDLVVFSGNRARATGYPAALRARLDDRVLGVIYVDGDIEHVSRDSAKSGVAKDASREAKDRQNRQSSHESFFVRLVRFFLSLL